MKLSELEQGNFGIITKVRGRGAFRRRIIEMGFVKGKKVETLVSAPLNDPTEYRVMGYEVSLRKSEAELIEIVTEEEARQQATGSDNKPARKAVFQCDENQCDACCSFHGYRTLLSGNNPATGERDLYSVAREQSKIINVALVGNPNSGKTSLFNIASGTHEHTGNYSGVTVDAKKGKFEYGGYTFNLTDLPGTYSLSAYSPEELYVRRHIAEGTPDVIINVVAASNIERNLYLTAQLIDMDATVVLALNMYDELEKSGATLDCEQLSGMFGMPIVPTVAKTGKGIRELFDRVIEVYEGRNPVARHIHINYGEEIETGIRHVQRLLNEEKWFGADTSRRYLSMLLLEGDREAEKRIEGLATAKKICEERDIHARFICEDFKEDVETAFTSARYGFINGALLQTFSEGKTDTMKNTRIIDRIVTSKLWGYPLFLLFMFLTFECTFILGKYPMEGIEWAVGKIGDFIGSLMPTGMLKDLLINGIIGGVGSVIVFLPNIVILYMFISFMEDTGYMARAAFIMDKFMQKMGLHGKSFFPLVMGFGCNVPAIISTRIIESRNTRLMTMLVNPLMSCSARLPLYILLIGAFFPDPLHGGLVFFCLYMSGIALAVLISRLLKRFLIKGEDLPFVMELPPYRMPTLKAMSRHAWERTSQYLKKMGGIILVASIAVWLLGYFPNDGQKENSYIGKIGHFIEPAVSPLGFDWKIGASLLSGMAAKEIVVSTMGIIYTGKDETEFDTREQFYSALQARLLKSVDSSGKPVYSPLVALSFLLFVLIYFPCIATIAAIKNESGSWKWAGFTVLYTTALAWLVSFTVYQTGSFFWSMN